MCVLGREATPDSTEENVDGKFRRISSKSYDLAAKRVFVVEVGDFCTAFRPEIIISYTFHLTLHVGFGKGFNEI